MRYGLLRSGPGVSALVALALAWAALMILLVELARTASYFFS